MIRAGVTVAMLSVAFAACITSNGGAAPADAGDGGALILDASDSGVAVADAADSGGAIADGAGNDATVGACASKQDCLNYPFPAGLGVWCCIDKTCVYGVSVAYALACTDANMQPIQASSYDQSCQKDDDCVAMAEGNFCDPGATVCPFSGAINKSAYAQYQADVAKTNAAICGAVSSCGLSLGPCCQSGTCQTGNTCAAFQPPDAAADSGDASAE
jgi:hypothetical protein